MSSWRCSFCVSSRVIAATMVSVLVGSDDRGWLRRRGIVVCWRETSGRFCDDVASRVVRLERSSEGASSASASRGGDFGARGSFEQVSPVLDEAADFLRLGFVDGREHGRVAAHLFDRGDGYAALAAVLDCLDMLDDNAPLDRRLGLEHASQVGPTDRDELRGFDGDGVFGSPRAAKGRPLAEERAARELDDCRSHRGATSEAAEV